MNKVFRRVVLGALALGLVGGILLGGDSVWAQKVKPPQPPQPPADPAIAYVENVHHNGKLMVMNADGSNQRAVLSERYFEYAFPNWSPDGQFLVFTRQSYKTGAIGIYIIGIDGTGLRKVTDTREFWNNVAWTPMPLADGAYKISFQDYPRRSDGTYSTITDAYMVNLDGTGLVHLTDTPNVSESCINWSPTADRVTFPAADPVTGAGGFVICSVNYSEGVFSLEPVSYCYDFGFGVWANTQDKIAVGRGGEGWANDLWVYDISMPNLSYPLTSTQFNYELEGSWSPDDTKILFVQGPTGQLYLINSDGSGGLTPICIGVDFSYKWPHFRRNR